MMVATASVLTLGCAAAALNQGSARTAPVFANGQAQIVPGFQDPKEWIHQELWVAAEFDTDGDGKKDRMHVDVRRPRQTATEGLKVPVIYESSPYFSGTSGPRNSLWDVKQEVGDVPRRRTNQAPPTFRAKHDTISNSQVNTWVPRGFAVVHSEASGTGLSQGCPTVGDAPERLGPKAVIDWLNGRAKGFTTATGSEQVYATWSTGKVGMTGTSYNGTLPIAAALTGVKGLEAIIPISPNTSYYHYYRSNGLVRHPGDWLGEDIDFLYDFVHSGDTTTAAYCNTTWRDGIFAAGRDRQHGDFNDFWLVRDQLPLVKNIKAAVLLAHGLNDWNVVPEHSIRIHESLKAHHIPAMLYLHQGGHGGGPPAELANQWFTHYLYGVANGVDTLPRAWIVREGGGRGALPTPYADYPVPGAEPVSMHLATGGNALGGLSVVASPRQGNERLVDDVQFTGAVLAQAEKSENRLLYATAVLTDSIHISGTPRITLRLASSKAAANVSVWLVVLPFDKTAIGTQSFAGLITRGWADPQNYKSLKKGGNYDSKAPGEPLKPGQFYEMTFDLQPDDQIVPPGKRIGLMIMSSDRDFTLWPKAGTELTIDLDKTSVSLPVVGGATAVKKALGAVP